VRCRFHGALARGWVLGPTDDVPARTLPVSACVSPIRFFDAEMLRLARWLAERYVAPLATVIDRLAPPRVVSEEAGRSPFPVHRELAPATAGDGPLPTYRGADRLLHEIGSGEGAFLVRPAPDEEVAVVLDAVRACVAGGRRALVLVPEAAPLPATARAIVDAFGDRARTFAGGDRRHRYRAWLDVRDGDADVVVGTRPAVFAPVADLGLIWVSRESHPGHREERSPATHVRDVAFARARAAGAVLALAAICPSAEATSMGLLEVVPGRRRWPKVEVVRPGRSGRAARLMRLLPGVERGFLLSGFRGYGRAEVCRSCGAPAACAACGGTLRMAEGDVRCVVCDAEGRCRNCGGTRFGIRPGGAERVVEWAGQTATVPVRAPGRPRLPRRREILVGGAADVRELGPAGLDLVAILDADLGLRRPGSAGRERALATWMDAAGWATPQGRVLVQTEAPADPAIQALVRGDARRFHERERERRATAGFPVGAAVFRVIGDGRLPAEIETLPAITRLVTTLAERTVCLLALEPGDVRAFGGTMRSLAARGVVERVEADPHL
jgi:primosomal protein N' (replication factor Y)